MRKYVPAIVVFSSVCMLAVTGFVFALASFRTATQLQFDESTNTVGTALQRSLNDKLLLLDSMHSLYAIFDGRPQPQFRRFVQPFEQELEGVQALQWTVPVTHAERAAFELSRQLDGAAGFMITERDASGRMVRAATRDLYFPVYPVLPLDEGESTIGFDLASNEVRYTALQKAIISGAAAASARVSLLQGSGEEYGFIVFKPLFQFNTTPETAVERLDALTGLVLGVFHVGSIVNEVLQSVPDQPVNYTIRDLNAVDEQQILFSHNASDTDTAPAFFGWQPAAYIQTLEIVDRTWQLSAIPSPGFMADKHAVSAWVILGVGLLLAGTLAVYLIEHVRTADNLKLAEAQRQSLENQLFRSQKMDAIGRLVGGIAHDFNNLLTSIMGYAELGLYQRDGESIREYLQHILQGGEKGKGLISKLLSFSRNEPAQNLPQFLPPLVENTLSMLKPVMPARINIRFAAESGLPRVSIDTTSLDQILVNLCINARDAITGQGMVNIALKYRHIAGNKCMSCQAPLQGDFVILSVEDSGAGIPAEVLPRIFKPFYTTKSPGNGTGLGLSIIHNITHGCNGHILVSSEPGKGTQFKLLFPLADADVQAPLQQVG